MIVNWRPQGRAPFFVPAPLVRFVILLAYFAVVHSQRTASAED
jgi:hypothetical protein